MTAERRPMSVSQFSELVGIEPARFLGVEVDRLQSTVTLVVEEEMAQTSGTFPQLSDNKVRGPKKGGKKQ